jgi:hypothetical protein
VLHTIPLKGGSGIRIRTKKSNIGPRCSWKNVWAISYRLHLKRKCVCYIPNARQHVFIETKNCGQCTLVTVLKIWKGRKTVRSEQKSCVKCTVLTIQSEYFGNQNCGKPLQRMICRVRLLPYATATFCQNRDLIYCERTLLWKSGIHFTPPPPPSSHKMKRLGEGGFSFANVL